MIKAGILKIAGLVCLLAALLCFGSLDASAQSCSFSITDVNFGSVDLTQGSAIDVTATFTATCSAGNATTVRVCPNINLGTGGSASGGTPRYMLSGGNQLSFSLYQDAARTNEWGSTVSGTAFGPPTVDVPILLPTNTVTRTIYGSIFASQQGRPTGTYNSSFAGGQTLISYRNGTTKTCAQIGTANGTQAPFTVQANYVPTCRVSAAGLNFGSLAGTAIASGVDGATNVTTTCSAQTPYSVALDGGLTSATNPTQRKMSMGTNMLTYGLYQDYGRTLPWGATSGTDTNAGVGTGLGQPIPVYGRVPNQSVPPPGNYNDTIVVTVVY